ncbi:hypothetical protein [Roseovarius autotrophicus]|uniref:hypothetical protein n=1 Tax=Roseovarius autotrophicus TaxID=2824121 RepID=UPI001B36D194|nr:hypothetical protein [Roseovarius autotrophicus]
MDRLLAIDSGLTVTKAAIFDLEGNQIAVCRRNVPQREVYERRPSERLGLSVRLPRRAA